MLTWFCVFCHLVHILSLKLFGLCVVETVLYPWHKIKFSTLSISITRNLLANIHPYNWSVIFLFLFFVCFLFCFVLVFCSSAFCIKIKLAFCDDCVTFLFILYSAIFSSFSKKKKIEEFIAESVQSSDIFTGNTVSALAWPSFMTWKSSFSIVYRKLYFPL